jgi:2-polyprenyl-6-methoxyphenol hydroxylase-like FAD-dependent oxidoreductase
VYTFTPWPEYWEANAPFDLHDSEAAKRALIDEFHDWDTELLDLVRHGQDLEPRPLYMLPVGRSWENCPEVTLVGDAAHIMTPFAGEGVHLGMQDSLLLPRAMHTQGVQITHT